MLEKYVESATALAFAAAFTALCIWIPTLGGFTWEQSALLYLIVWVVLWDKRHVVKKMREYEEKQKRPSPEQNTNET